MSAIKFLMILVLGTCFSSARASPPEPAPERRSQLIHMVRQDCGSCHGMTFKGGLGPPLTQEAMRTKPADAMAASILYGRSGTAMPPWRQFINEQEAAWIVEQLRAGFPQDD